jgi:hypothetical protein
MRKEWQNCACYRRMVWVGGCVCEFVCVCVGMDVCMYMEE